MTDTENVKPAAWWHRSSAKVLLIVNVVPLMGVAFLGWDIFPVMVVYWLENLVIGFFTVLKILVAAGPGKNGGPAPHVLGRIPMVAFFTVHYGMFCLVHGMFVFSLFGQDADLAAMVVENPTDLDVLMTLLVESQLLVVLVVLFISHAYSFADNFIRAGEYQRVSPDHMFASPYGRIVVLHLVVLAGGFLVASSGSAIWALVLLVILKTVLDSVFHHREHRKLESGSAVVDV